MSSTGASALTLTTAVVITSRAVAPAFPSRSNSLTIPSRAPVESITGAALIRLRVRVCAACWVESSGLTVATGEVMMSPAVIGSTFASVRPDPAAARRYRRRDDPGLRRDCEGDQEEAAVDNQIAAARVADGEEGQEVTRQVTGCPLPGRSYRLDGRASLLARSLVLNSHENKQPGDAEQGEQQACEPKACAFEPDRQKDQQRSIGREEHERLRQ